MKNRLLIFIIMISIAVLVLFPFIIKGYLVRFLTTFFMFVILAQAWNILGGFTGYPSFGNVAFFGIGAYTTGILMTRFQQSFALSVATGAIITVIFAILVGIPVLRTRGHYFAIATFGVAETTREIINNLKDQTGGGMGISLPIMKGGVEFINNFFYFFMFLFMITVILLTYKISKSRLGYGLNAIREDEQAAGVMGIDATKYKVIAFAISAMFTSIAGSGYAYWLAFIEPSNVFDVKVSVTMIVMAILGGAGTVAGPLIGAFILEVLNELLWTRFLEYHMAFLGIIIVFVVIFMPRGFVEIASRGRKALSWQVITENIKKYRV